MLHANFAVPYFTEQESLPIEVLNCENRNWPFWLLWPWTWPGDLRTWTWRASYSLEIYRMFKYELPTWRLSKVIVWQTDRQTDDQNTTPLRGWSAKPFWWPSPRGLFFEQDCFLTSSWSCPLNFDLKIHSIYSSFLQLHLNNLWNSHQQFVNT